VEVRRTVYDRIIPCSQRPGSGWWVPFTDDWERSTLAEAQADLDAYAREHNWRGAE
jgi:hypothetical protein